jgi:hypothetical protein
LPQLKKGLSRTIYSAINTSACERTGIIFAAVLCGIKKCRDDAIPSRTPPLDLACCGPDKLDHAPEADGRTR